MVAQTETGSRGKARASGPPGWARREGVSGEFPVETATGALEDPMRNVSVLESCGRSSIQTLIRPLWPLGLVTDSSIAPRGAFVAAVRLMLASFAFVECSKVP